MKIIIGAGGGYDIVIAAMLKNRLNNEFNEEIDVGGMLNPKFMHFFNNESEQPVNLVRSAYKFRIDEAISQNFDSYLRSGKQVPFVDSELSKILNCRIYDFSLRFGVEPIAKFLAKQYDDIIFCDVGGDILFFSSEDSSVKTPIIDAFSLKVANMYSKLLNKSCYLILVGLGLDGEMRPINLNNNMRVLEKENAIRCTEKLNVRDYSYLENIYNKVRVGEKGKTNQLLIDIAKNNLEDNDLVKRRRILEYKEWFHKIIWVNTKCVYDHNPLCYCDTINEMKIKARELGVVIRE